MEETCTERTRIDLGIVRGLAYYTGFIFEAFERSGKTRSIAGGGRYDDLVKRLGYMEIPAVGFGMGDVTLTDALEARNLLHDLTQAPEIYVVIGGEAERITALGDIALLLASSINENGKRERLRLRSFAPISPNRPRIFWIRLKIWCLRRPWMI